MQSTTLRHTLTLSILMFMPPLIAAASSSNDHAQSTPAANPTVLIGPYSLQQLAIDAFLLTPHVRKYAPQGLSLDTTATKKKLHKRINARRAELALKQNATQDGDRIFLLKLQNPAVNEDYINRGMENFVNAWKEAARLLNYSKSWHNGPTDSDKLQGHLTAFDRIFTIAHYYGSPYGQVGCARYKILDKNDLAILNALPAQTLYDLMDLELKLYAQYRTILRACTFATKISSDCTQSDTPYWNELASKGRTILQDSQNLLEKTRSVLAWFKRHDIAHMFERLSAEDDQQRHSRWAIIENEAMAALRGLEAEERRIARQTMEERRALVAHNHVQPPEIIEPIAHAPAVQQNAPVLGTWEYARAAWVQANFPLHAVLNILYMLLRTWW